MMRDNDKIAYCGLYCPMCSYVAAFETKNRAHLLAMPERYDRYKQQTFEDCKCSGCKNDEFCGPCKMKACASTKDIISCADCDGFPCKHIKAFGNDGVPHHADAINNLLRIKEVGYEQWQAEMNALLYCHCGVRQSWYYTCPEHC